MSGHTPGEWKAKKYGSKNWSVGVREDHDMIQVWAEPCSDQSPETAKSNARLIAAAPDLLEACKGLRGIVHDYLTHESQRLCATEIKAADAAIAKAEGGAA